MSATRRSRDISSALLLAALGVSILVVAALFALVLRDHAVSPGPVSQAERVQAGSIGGSSKRLVLAEPRPVPDLRFEDSSGQSLSLADFRGRVVLLNIWATWCVPCRKEMPTLDRLQAALGSPEFQVVALSIDRGGLRPVRDFYREIGVKQLSIYVDARGRSNALLGIAGIPATLLIDRKGHEIGRLIGAAEWDSPDIVSVIQQAIQQPAADIGNPSQRASKPESSE